MYNKGDYIKVMTNQPEVHLNEMFGYNDLEESDFEKTEYIAFIKSVIDDSTYLVMTVSPNKGFRCIVDIADVIGLIQKSELSQEELDVKELEDFEAPNLYYPAKVPMKKTVDGKCKLLAKEAITALFPEEDIASIDLSHSDYLKSCILEQVDFYLDNFCQIARQDLVEEKTGKRDMLKKTLNKLKFKEYYSVMVGCYEKEEHRVIRYQTVAVSTYFDEVSIVRDPIERHCFENSLGPDFDIISRTLKKFLNELKW